MTVLHHGIPHNGRDLTLFRFVRDQSFEPCQSSSTNRAWGRGRYPGPLRRVFLVVQGHWYRGSGAGAVVKGHWYRGTGAGALVQGHWYRGTASRGTGRSVTGIGALVQGHWYRGTGAGALRQGHWCRGTGAGALVAMGGDGAGALVHDHLYRGSATQGPGTRAGGGRGEREPRKARRL